jgi:hypothetical protein
MSETKALREVLEKMRKYAGLSCRFFPGWVNEASAELDALLAENAEFVSALKSIGIVKYGDEWVFTTDGGDTPADNVADALQETLELEDEDMSILRSDNTLLRKQLDEAIEVIEAGVTVYNNTPEQEHTIMSYEFVRGARAFLERMKKGE